MDKCTVTEIIAHRNFERRRRQDRSGSQGSAPCAAVSRRRGSRRRRPWASVARRALANAAEALRQGLTAWASRTDDGRRCCEPVRPARHCCSRSRAPTPPLPTRWKSVSTRIWSIGWSKTTSKRCCPRGKRQRLMGAADRPGDLADVDELVVHGGEQHPGEDSGRHRRAAKRARARSWCVGWAIKGTVNAARRLLASRRSTTPRFAIGVDDRFAKGSLRSHRRRVCSPSGGSLCPDGGLHGSCRPR